VIFSSDSKDDAIASLARHYDVSSSQIHRVIGNNWPDFVDWTNSAFHPVVATLMGQALGSKTTVCDIEMAAYYHRTRYDGTKEWFSDGLVDPLNGAIKIINAMRPFLGNDEYDSVLSASRKIIDQREAMECGQGLCAFDVFEDALHALQSGMSYSVPEFVSELCRNSVKGGQKLADAIKRELRPVVVKFRAKPTDPDEYIVGLWNYLYRLDYGNDGQLIYTKPNGVVAFRDILELKWVEA